jgi:hypothetical protein
MSWAYAETILYNLANFDLGDEYFFELYLQEKYGVFGEDGYPLYDIDDIKQSLSPEKLAAEKLGFLIFKDAYKAAILGKVNYLVDTEKERKAAEAAAAASSYGGGGGYIGDSGGGGSGGGSGGGGAWQTGWMSGFQLVDTRPRTEIGVEFLDEGFVPEEQT